MNSNSDLPKSTKPESTNISLIKKYFPRFTFGPFKTVFAIVLSCLMLWASSWQWQRYNYKVELQKKLQLNTKNKSDIVTEDFFLNNKPEDIKFKKISLEGQCDFEREMILLNRRHASGPGYLLLCPFKLKNSKYSVLVSRGFIPFHDRSLKNWKKYQNSINNNITALVKVSKSPGFLTPKNPEASLELPFERKWLFIDVPAIAKQLPYPVIEGVYLDKYDLENPNNSGFKKDLKPGAPRFTFPSEHIKLEVPPEVHFGYTFEWILLAFATLLITFLVQAFPRNKRKNKK